MTAYAIKTILCIALFLGNTAVTMIDGEKYTTLYLLMRTAGAMSVPIACFFLVEGFYHTSSKKKYFVRLFLCSLIAELPFLFCSLNGLRRLVGVLEREFGEGTMPSADIMKQLAEKIKDERILYYSDLYNSTARYAVCGLMGISMMLLVLMLLDRLREKYFETSKLKFGILSSLLLLGALVMLVIIPFENPLPILFFTSVFYFLRGNRAGIAVMSVMLVSFFYLDAGLMISMGPILGVLLCFTYNGRQSNKTDNKENLKFYNKVFYVIYPLQYMILFAAISFV